MNTIGTETDESTGPQPRRPATGWVIGLAVRLAVGLLVAAVVSTAVLSRRDGFRDDDLSGEAQSTSAVPAEPTSVVPGGPMSPDTTSPGRAAGSASAGGRGSTGSASATVADLHTVDFRNFRHPDPPCDSELTHQPIETHEGTFESLDGMRLEVQPVRYGDLTGDGRDEAVVLLTCSGSRDPRSSGCGEASPDSCSAPNVRVYTSDATKPGGLAMLAPLDVAGDPGIRAATGADDLVIASANVEDGQLVTRWTGYTATDPGCCPTRDVELRHRWTGRSWALAAPAQVHVRPAG